MIAGGVLGSILTALGQVGGLAVVGALIDLAIRRGEKEKVEHFLIFWWDRFDSIRWQNFGQRESELAIQVLDRLVGHRLFSWRRLVSVLAVAGIGLLVAAGLTLWTMSIAVERAESPHGPLWSYLVESIGSIQVLATLVAAAIAFAVSLSLTRFISRIVAIIPVGTLSGVLTYAGLLVVHIALFVFWAAIVVHLFLFLARPFTMVLLGGGSPFGAALYFAKLDLMNFTFERHWLSLKGMWGVEPSKSLMLELVRYPSSPTLTSHAVGILIHNIGRVFDVAAYGLRIGFALVFLSSYLFRPLVQAPITRLWAGIIDSRRPIFAMMFGGVGALIVFVQALLDG